MWDSKYLSTLPDLSHIPKIELIHVGGCVNLAQIHSSTCLRKDVALGIQNNGPVQVKVGGNIKGASSGLVMVYHYLDLKELSLNEVTMKVFVHGKIICGVRFKHVVMPLKEIEELRSLACSLPFVWKVDWLESPIEHGDDFKQHYNYTHYIYHDPNWYDVFMKREYSVEERGERGVVGALRREMINDNEEEEEDEELLLVEYYCCGGYTTAPLLTRLPNSITRWSLLKILRMKESDNTIPLSYEYWKGIKPHLDVTLSLPDIPPSAASPPHYFHILHALDIVISSHDSFMVTWIDYRAGNGFRTRINKKRG